MNKWWKDAERRIARYFGTERNPLSGGMSKHTRSDTLHPLLYIEVKARQHHGSVALWDDTNKKALKEGKVPVVVLKVKGRPGFWLMAHALDMNKIVAKIRGDG